MMSHDYFRDLPLTPHHLDQLQSRCRQRNVKGLATWRWNLSRYSYVTSQVIEIRPFRWAYDVLLSKCGGRSSWRRLRH